MKAITNRDERKLFCEIFSLNAIKQVPTDKVNQVDQLVLDFHCVNFAFCKENAYSNEKISTLMAIMDFILHTMIDKVLLVEKGITMLKEILEKHNCHRPPFCILIFNNKEVTQIVNFMLKTFFRHYSLYEYAFKPKVEIVLQTLPKGGIPRDVNSRIIVQM